VEYTVKYILQIYSGVEAKPWLDGMHNMPYLFFSNLGFTLFLCALSYKYYLP